jgi:hypothetical protein
VRRTTRSFIRKLLISVQAIALTFFGAAMAADDNEVRIELSQEEPGIWRVDYRLTLEARRLELVRTPDDSRAENWLPARSDFEIIHENGRDYIQRKRGSAFSEVSILMPAVYTTLPKEYAPFSPFSDGGLLVYTGRFHACPESCQAEGLPDSWTIHVVPPPDTHTILHGEILEGPTSWEDRGNGLKFYVGVGEPIETEHVIAIVDRSLPDELRFGLDAMFPSMMAFFAEQLGDLEEKPMLFMSYDPGIMSDAGRQSGHIHLQGATLPNQVFMHLAGGWADADLTAHRNSFLWFFAHEAAHLYQHRAGRMGGGMEETWIHEGGADAFAVLALTSLKVAPGEYVESRLKGAVKNCAQGLSDGALSEAGSRSNFQVGRMPRSDGSRDGVLNVRE